MTVVGQYAENVNGAALVEQPTPGPQRSVGSVDKPQDKPERKWQMIRLRAGDYLLPSNDRKTIWRLNRYEDGPSYGIENMERDEEYWRVSRWVKPKYGSDTPDPDDWDQWHIEVEYLPTRKAAIEEAMSRG